MTVETVERTTLPLTGEEYLESLRDGREIWIYGERVKDITTHPAFRNATRMVARLYDALHDPEKQAVLTCPTDTGNGGFTHKFFRASRSAEESGRRARCNCRMGAVDVWLDGAQP
jgi:4-hydroxyphenylacetate 3-monooxygenase